ncbi:hypothetical protein PPACK8108_LOCUS9778 [Phakopsora pachyrhizi]|uniref:Uncharacterized protein n=1 Tax=Phakopsora pachyrhizi TaxID=170000 RepID=A0AAV0AZ04_PHAPC|nr:hypothetical protein PPACK8108_LOCUS9778 [Phakopsora pachyrhizi]
MPSLLDSLGQPVIEKMRTFSDDPNSKRSQTPHGSVARMSREINKIAQAQNCSKLIQLEDTVWKYKCANYQLYASIQVLNLQQTTSDTICRHLESQLQEVLDELNNPSWSMTIKDLNIRLNLENKRLQELLREEVKARNKAKQQRFKGTQALSSTIILTRLSSLTTIRPTPRTRLIHVIDSTIILLVVGTQINRPIRAM